MDKELLSRDLTTLRRCYNQCILQTALFLSILTIDNWTNGDSIKAKIYLSKYGYLPPMIRNAEEAKQISNKIFSRALAEFQDFTGLNKTGVLDQQTLKLMNTRRCGVPDKVYDDHGRSKRYVLEGSKWDSTDLKYYIKDYSKGSFLTKKDIDKGIDKSLSMWSKVSNLAFKKIDSVKGCHIEIRFANKSHGDYEPFDGPGNLLAHGFYPETGGDTHFDDEEDWSMKNNEGTNFIQTASHELGHALGLSHSDVKTALMSAYYNENIMKVELHEDDIEGIQALYGKKGGPIPTLDPDEDSFYAKPRVPAACIYRIRIDAAYTDKRGSTYLFMGDKLWKIGTYGTEKGYPKLITSGFPKAPSNVDAAVTFSGNFTYIFKDRKVWRYYKNRLSSGYPKYINKVFKGIPDKIDAAFEFKKKIYFLKGSKYWKYDPKFWFLSRKSYPKTTSKLKGVPNKVDAATYHPNGHVYLFQNDKYWRLNKRMTGVDKDSTPYPRSTREWWFYCTTKKRNSKKL